MYNELEGDYMTYLDYSATTPVNKSVLESFNKTCLEYIGNPNSLHKLGVKSKELEESATKQIATLLNVKENEIIYTSGSSESNNLAIKGICERYERVGKHIITTNLEHSSIYGPIGYLQKKGYEIDFVKTNNGLVDLDDLKQKIRKDTVLVTIASVNSEVGIRQNIEEIGKLLKDYPCYFHVDATQSIGKVNIDFKNVDLVSFSAHKIFGLKGIGCLIKKEKIDLLPLIHGGKSTTVYRSGTPALPLIVSLAKALRLALEDLDEKIKYINDLNHYLKENIQEATNVQYYGSNQTGSTFVNYGDKSKIGVIMGVLPEIFDTRPMYLTNGRLITQNDIDCGANVAVIPEMCVKGLFGNFNPIGKKVIIPSYIEQFPVRKIEKKTFLSCKYLSTFFTSLSSLGILKIICPYTLPSTTFESA